MEWSKIWSVEQPPSVVAVAAAVVGVGEPQPAVEAVVVLADALPSYLSPA